MLYLGGTKYVNYKNDLNSGMSTTEASESDYTAYEADSGHDDVSLDDDLEASEEIILPNQESGEYESEDDVYPTIIEDDEEILQRQMSYPPLPEYIPPSLETKSKDSPKKNVSKKKKKVAGYHPRERIGVLTPMEEVTEPPSSAGTEASGGTHLSRPTKGNGGKTKRKTKIITEQEDVNYSVDQQKSILKSKSPTSSPERKVTFSGPNPKGEKNTQRKYSNDEMNKNTSKNLDKGTKVTDEILPEKETDLVKVPAIEEIDKVQNWNINLANDNEEFPTSNIDFEFPSILDDIIADLHSWDRLAGKGASLTEINASRQDHLANISSQLATFMTQISPPVMTSNLPQLIPLITTLLNVTEVNFRAQLSSLNAVNVFAERLKDCKSHSGLKVIPNADLTWMIRSLCDIASDSPRSVLKNVGTSTLASLVKAAGPEMVSEPIFLILMGDDEKVPKQREGSGNIVYTGIPGGQPKVKATALDTLTFALLTFPRDNFNLDEISKLACHCLLHPKRRIRQGALECLAVISNALGPNTALPMFKKLISQEEIATNENMNSELAHPKSPTHHQNYDPQLQMDPRILGPPSKIPVPIKVLEAQQKASAELAQASKPPPPPTNSPSKSKKSVNPSSAVSARISRHVLPSPNLEELVEYGVKIPANSQLLSRQTKKVGGQTIGDDRGGLSSSESCSSVSNIEYGMLELEPVLNAHGSGGRRKGHHVQELIMAPDIEWILDGIGPVKKCDPTTMLPKELSGLTFGSSTNYNFGNTSGTESDYSCSVASTQGSRGQSDSTMRRAESGSDLSSSQTNMMLGRYYMPQQNNQTESTRGGLHSSDSLNLRQAPKTSFGLLPNKYPILRNNNNSQYHGGGGHDLISPHVLLPGAYDSHSYGSAVGSSRSITNWHSELGSLSNVQMKPKPLDPIISLREKYFESERRNSGAVDSHLNRSDSQQSGSTEAEESENEQNMKPQQQIRNKNTNNRKPPIVPKQQRNTNASEQQDKISVRRQSETLMQGMNREYQVYHSRVELDNSAVAKKDPAKRVDADSAGSNHTRDSGVSVGGSKTPPSAHNTPPSQHRTPSPGFKNVERSPKNSAQDKKLHRNWRSTPDVPQTIISDRESKFDNRSGLKRLKTSGDSLVKVSTPVIDFHPISEQEKLFAKKLLMTATSPQRSIRQVICDQLKLDDVCPQDDDERRDSSGSSSHSHAQVSSRSTNFAQESANMPVHRKPVLARRGQSVSRIPGEMPPPMKHPSSRSNEGSGDSYEQEEPDNKVYNYRVETSAKKQIRNSISTGDLVDETDGPRLSYSNSAYLLNQQKSESSRTGRLGPFGDVRASVTINDGFSERTVPIKKPLGAKINGKIVPTKVYKGSFRDINSRKDGSIKNEVFPLDLKPVTSPKHALPMALGQLESSDWETNVTGFKQLVRIIRFDIDYIHADLHNINLTALKHLTNLRSQVCRSAILCFKELFSHCGRAMEPDCEKIAEKLLDKSADTNKFIREDSGRALESMMVNVTPIKGMTCLDLFGTRHRNPVVRTTTAKLTATLVENVGPERCLAELPERLLPMLCKLLQEGSLETRTAAKAAMSNLMTHPSFHQLLRRYVPSDVLRHAQKSIDALQK